MLIVKRTELKLSVSVMKDGPTTQAIFQPDAKILTNVTPVMDRLEDAV